MNPDCHSMSCYGPIHPPGDLKNIFLLMTFKCRRPTRGIMTSDNKGKGRDEERMNEWMIERWKLWQKIQETDIVGDKGNDNMQWQRERKRRRLNEWIIKMWRFWQKIRETDILGAKGNNDLWWQREWERINETMKESTRHWVRTHNTDNIHIICKHRKTHWNTEKYANS